MIVRLAQNCTLHFFGEGGLRFVALCFFGQSNGKLSLLGNGSCWSVRLVPKNNQKLEVGAVCVYHQMVGTACHFLKNTSIPVAAVSTGFPGGLTPHKTKVLEIKESIKQGAHEIDIVISRRHVLNGNWKKLYDEISDYRDVCGNVCLKTILATGELGTLRNVAKASWVCMMAGADFIKTSTGKEKINATLVSQYC